MNFSPATMISSIVAIVLTCDQESSQNVDATLLAGKSIDIDDRSGLYYRRR